VSCTSDKGIEYDRLAAEKHLTSVSDYVKAKIADKWVSRGIYFAE
jgi:tryptophanyl-tRNA synthetase